MYAIVACCVRAGAGLRIHDVLEGWIRATDGRAPPLTATIRDSQSVPGADTVPGDSRAYDTGTGPTAVHDTSPWHEQAAVGGDVHSCRIRDRDGAHRGWGTLRDRFSGIESRVRRRRPCGTARATGDKRAHTATAFPTTRPTPAVTTRQGTSPRSSRSRVDSSVPAF
ncbi:hypothetical protein CSW53_08890 [Rhodococcus ruber]|nr:hypothetical protein CSW53_08890 [Rhodococcus ruber]